MSPNANTVQFVSRTPIADAFPGGHAAAAVFALLQPAQKPAGAGRQNDLRARDGTAIVNPGRLGQIFRGENPFDGWINLPNGHNRQLREGKFTQATAAAQLGDPEAPDFGAMFEPKLLEVVDPSDEVAVLRAGGKSYLYPFREEILRHLTPGALVRSVHVSGDPAAGLTVSLRIPVQQGLTVRYDQRYFSTDVVSDYPTPELTLWPDFESDQWKHYFYVVRQFGANQNLVPRPAAEVVGEYQHGEHFWGQTATFPAAWVVAADNHRGLLLLLPRRKVEANNPAWDVSIDFGSTHTRVFRKTQGLQGNAQAEPVDLRPRTVDLLGRSMVLTHTFFYSGRDEVRGSVEPRSLVRLPLKKPAGGTDDKWLPSRGIIFWNPVGPNAHAEGLRANLKWHADESEDLPAFHSYISQLFLSVAAEAAAEGSEVRSVITAYPSVFPQHLRYSHEQEWRTLQTRFGVQMKPPMPESSALAAHLVFSRGAAPAANLLAVDVGGSTSDLAVWSGGSHTRGDSVRLAGDLMSRLVNADAGVREVLREAARRQPIAELINWRGGNNGDDGLIFNDLLRKVAEKHGSTMPLARGLDRGSGSAGERVIAFAGYLYASV
ncbi:MAG: hypothetical protein M3P24_07340, partial [Gemmatimonadota bacterium]|nr:hypothetical protein [Gemmatimonadota bacterium]